MELHSWEGIAGEDGEYIVLLNARAAAKRLDGRLCRREGWPACTRMLICMDYLAGCKIVFATSLMHCALEASLC